MRVSKFVRLIANLLIVFLVQSNYPATASENFLDISLPKIYSNGCHLSQIETDPKYCAYGNLNSKFKVVLVGDSHATQWFPALEKLAISKNFKLLTLTHSSCPFAYLKFYEECMQWNAKTVKIINRLNPNILVWSNLVKENYPTNSAVQVTTKNWAKGFEIRLKQLKMEKTKIYYIEDSPFPNFDVVSCLSLNPEGTNCSFASTQSYSESEVFKILKANRVNIVRTRSWFCDFNDCGLLKGNFNIYRDYSHISVAMSENLASVFSQVVNFSR